MVALSRFTTASSPWPSCLAASLTSLMYSFYVIIGWVKREGSPSFMQMFDISALGGEIPAKVFGKTLPNHHEKYLCLSYGTILGSKWFQSVFKFVNILIFSETHGFHPVFCSNICEHQAFPPGSPLKIGGGIFTLGVSSSSESGFRLGSGMIPPCVHAYVGLADTFTCAQGWLAGQHLRVHLLGFLGDP